MELRHPIEFSIITPVWDRLNTIKPFFSSLLENTDWSRAELIVVDQGSRPFITNYVIDAIRTLPQFRLIRNRTNVGVPRAWNLGLRVSEGNIVICISSDLIIPRGWLDELRRVLMFPKAGCVSISSQDVIDKGLCLQEVVQGGNGIRVRRAIGNTGEMMCFTRGTQKRLGYFNEEYGLYGEEDADWGLRIGALGLLNLYSADMLIERVHVEDEAEHDSVKGDEDGSRRRLILKRYAEYQTGRSAYVPYKPDIVGPVPT